MRADPGRPAAADQAEGLRRLMQPRPVRVIAVTGGKGGVGKTNVSANLAVALAADGKAVLLLDADLGLANVDVLLGLQPLYNLSHVLAGERTLEEILVDGPRGLKIVPASSGIQRMTGLSAAEHAGLIRAFSELTSRIDVLLIDTAAGISDSVMHFTRAAQEVIVVVCDEPAAITDAYALIKVLSREHGQRRFRVLANMAHSLREGHELFLKMLRVCDRFLDVSLDFMGVVPQDEQLRAAVQRQRAVVDAFPSSRSSLAFRKLAQKMDRWPWPPDLCGRDGFFLERLIQAGGRAEADS
jgi:flagellar biosynthesis protein FlhG